MANKFELVDATPSFGGTEFKFQLTRELLNIGASKKIVYYSMHGARFRDRGGGVNFRPVVDSWWAAMREVGGPDEYDYQTRVWAEIHQVVSADRSLQDVYADAYLSNSLNREYAVPEEELARLRQLVETDLGQVQPELERLLLQIPPRSEEQTELDAMASKWIDDGMVTLSRHGEGRLRRWVGRIETRIAKLRRRGNAHLKRQFINRFSYEAKAAFHVCYANSWVRLIPWLVEHRDLDPVSERFMRWMHNLNRPDLPAAEGGRGPLCGQVLSLHPVSRFLVDQTKRATQYMGIIGRWIGHPQYEAISRVPADAAKCVEYRNFVVAILCAAHEYRHAHEEQESRRGQRVVSGQVPRPNDRGTLLDEQAKDLSSPNAARILEDYAVSQKIVCRTCGGVARFVRVIPPAEGQAATTITYRCEKGHPSFEIQVPFEQLDEWRRRPEDEEDQ
ncbi:MAG: hypothetical protein ABSH20_10930 [Tepidisphaeraceae bacterium]|jgi:hypothetical protein